MEEDYIQQLLEINTTFKDDFTEKDKKHLIENILIKYKNEILNELKELIDRSFE